MFQNISRGYFIIWSIGVGVLMGFAASAGANGLRNPPESAAALSQASGKTAHIHDPSAVAVNPANITGIDGTRIQSSFTLLTKETDFNDGLGRSGSSRAGEAVIPSFFGIMPLNEEFTFGLGITSPYGQSTEWSRSGPFGPAAPYFAEMILININPNVAWRLNDKISVAAGLDIFWSQLDFRQDLPLGPTGPLSAIRAKGDGTGVGGNLALTWNLLPKHTLAVTYRSSVEVDYDGDFTMSVAPAPLSTRSDFDSEIEFPNIVIVGYGFRVTENLSIGADAEWVEASAFDALPLGIGSNTGLAPVPPAIPQAWEDHWTYGLGLEYQLNDNWVARGGWAYLESPVPDATFAPTIPDDDRHLFSAGLGWANDTCQFDIAYAYSEYDRTVSGNVVPAYNGEYKTESHLLILSFGHKF